MIAIPGLYQLSGAVRTVVMDTWAQMTEIFVSQHDEAGGHTDVTASSRWRVLGL
jgi:hypothetical protein